MQTLERDLKNCLTDYHAANVRYRHLGFSAKNLNTLDDTLKNLSTLLPDYRVWNGEQPDQNAPPLKCSRQKFIAAVFEDSPQGLIIVHPELWFRRWQIADKQAFWEALSIEHGGHNVIVVFIENNEFATVNHRYFYPELLESAAVTAWISTKTKLS
jgi:hypothetical protein